MIYYYVHRDHDSDCLVYDDNIVVVLMVSGLDVIRTMGTYNDDDSA